MISGNDGAVLMSVIGMAANDAMGTAVAGNADINNDGLADVLVGAPLADSDAKDVGSVTVLFWARCCNHTHLARRAGKSRIRYRTGAGGSR
ncbi:MAG: FG-GAP repeat protein [Cellvibrionales bacterium]|nr:FG-GAP repeat protein [Cellvibrionales bacterium]